MPPKKRMEQEVVTSAMRKKNLGVDEEELVASSNRYVLSLKIMLLQQMQHSFRGTALN